MKEFVKKLIERLEEENNTASKTFAKFEMKVDLGRVFGLEKAIEIVKQLAEEYIHSKSKSLEKQPEEPQTNFYAERFNRVI